MKKSLIITFTLLLCALAAKADYFRWGTTSQSNYLYTYENSWKAVADSNAHAYLYLGTAQITDEGGKKVVHLDNLTYITDGGISNYRFGNNSAVKAANFKSNDNVLSAGDQPYTIILIGKKKYSESLSGAIKDNYEARSVTLFTSTSIGATSTDTTPVPYADCATNHAFNDKTKCIENVTFVRNTEPVGKGGYVTGYTNGNAGSIPTSQSSAYITDSNARMYIYKGTAEIRDDGVMDFSRLTYITNFIPALHGYFGNYDSEGVAKAKLYENDLISPEGGESFSIFVVTTDGKSQSAMPAQFYDYQTNNYVAIYNVTSVKKLTSDNWQYAQFTIDSKIVPADYNNGLAQTATPLVPIVFYNHVEYPPTSPYATIKIPKSYLVERFPGKTDAEITAASVAPRTEGNKCTILDSYVLGLDPDDAQSIPTVKPGQEASTTTMQLNVGNITVNPKANADVEYGLISSTSPDFTDPTQEVEPQASATLEATLPSTGVKYYRAQINVKGK